MVTVVWQLIKQCFSILDTNQLMKLDKNPTTLDESKIQPTLRKIKSKLSTEEYKNFVQLVPMLVDFIELQKYIKLIEMTKLINSLYAG